MIEKTKLFLKKSFDSLSYRIEKELKESIYKNKTYLENKWNYLEQLIVFWAKKPFSLILIIFIEFFAISLFTHSVYQLIKKKSYFNLNQS